VLNEVPCHEDVCGSGGTASRVFHFYARWNEGNQIKEDVMGGAFSKHWKREMHIKFWLKNLKGKDH
jgi:hypothetical protein